MNDTRKQCKAENGVGFTAGFACWTDALQVGDIVTIRECWNKTTRNDKIAIPTRALGIQRGTRSQSGTLIRVATALRDDAWLDSAWFLPNIKPPTTDTLTQKPNSNPNESGGD